MSAPVLVMALAGLDSAGSLYAVREVALGAAKFLADGGTGAVVA